VHAKLGGSELRHNREYAASRFQSIRHSTKLEQNQFENRILIINSLNKECNEEQRIRHIVHIKRMLSGELEAFKSQL
jgi:hypothetical protein